MAAEIDVSDSLDLVVIGSGPGGYVAAIRAAQLGLRVGVVEKDPKLGGTCLHRGCIPTKALLQTAGLLDKARHASDFGVETGEVRLDLEGARSFKTGVVERNAKGIEFLFKKGGIQTFHGRGRLVGRNEVEVTDASGSRTLWGKHILLATGSVPREIGMARSDGSKILNSDHLLELREVPESLMVLGAGAVGAEFASIFASFGSQVTLVEMLPRLLPLEDEEISKQLERSFRKRHIRTRTGTRLIGVEQAGDGLRMRLQREGRDPEELHSQRLLVAVGRAPVTEKLGLSELGIGLDRGYVEINEFMQTSVPHIYAIGDIVDTPWLAHVASAEGILAVEHMAGAPARPLNYDLVPGVTYCNPEVASVGLTEAQARDRGYDVACGKFPFTALAKAAIEGQTDGFVKVVRETRFDELLGVHIIGPHATDLIAEACVALQIESTTEELFRTIHAHPTLSEAVAEAAHAAVGHAIHI
jgi:dihydrolipoamide dehydrogenase